MIDFKYKKIQKNKKKISNDRFQIMNTQFIIIDNRSRIDWCLGSNRIPIDPEISKVNEYQMDYEQIMSIDKCYYLFKINTSFDNDNGL